MCCVSFFLCCLVMWTCYVFIFLVVFWSCSIVACLGFCGVRGMILVFGIQMLIRVFYLFFCVFLCLVPCKIL